MEMTYHGPALQQHPELGVLENGKTYEVSREQARWLSDEWWAPKGKARETRAKRDQQAERDAANADQAADVPGTPDVTGDTAGGADA